MRFILRSNDHSNNCWQIYSRGKILIFQKVRKNWEFDKLDRVRSTKKAGSALTSSFTKYKFFASEKYFCHNYEWTVSFEIVSAFEWWLMIFVACLHHLYTGSLPSCWLGPVGVAAAAAIASAKKKRRNHTFETNPSIRKRQATRLTRKLKVYSGSLRKFSGYNSETLQNSPN